jgi:VWFA-related protein
MAEHVKGWPLLQVVVSVWLCCLPVHTTAQTNASIVLNVTVVTKEGKFIGELSRDDFAVTVDKVPQNILSLNDREVPASVGILIDDSGSFYDGKKESATLKQHLKEGLERFLKLSHASNEYFVMTFASTPVIVQDWTTERSSVTSSVDAVKFKGQTSLYDAITNALPKVMTGRNAKHVLLVFTDGADNRSKKGFKEV